jgi:uncharacterized membrane protein
MEWLFILVLAGVAAWQGVRIGALTKRVRELEERLSARAAEAPTMEPLAAASSPRADEAAGKMPALQEEEPLLLDQPLPPDELEPLLLDQPIGDDELLLDTPLPEASNDDEPPPPEPQAAPIAEPARIARVLPPRAADFRFDQWLAEKGFAWIAGSALALGAIFLVSFATQQRWFTPQVQLALALALGAGLLGASEWARRVSLRRPPGHPLVAALLAGAGVVAFYATAWAAHGLYNFIDYATAAALLSICALILIGLSFLHGQAIGVLAIVAALLAPPLTHGPLWPSPALTLYVAAVGAAGFALAGFRRWGWVAVGTLVGLYFWFWAAIAVDDIRRALSLLSFASFGAVALALRPPLKEEDPSTLSWRRVYALGPTVGVAVSSVFLVWVWAAVAPAAADRVLGPALISVFHVALAAYAVRGRVAMAPALVVAIAALVFGAITYLRAREYYGPLDFWHYASLLTAALVVVICAIGARPHRDWRVTTAAAGAIGAALLTVLAVFTRSDWSAFDTWAPLFGGALLLFAAAWHAERDAGPRTERVIDFWAGAGAALVLLGVESAFPAEARAAAHAGAALMFASAFAWRGWRVFRYAALAAAAITIAHALSPSLIGATLAGQIPIWGALVILLVAALLLFGAAYFATAEPRSPYGEALSGAGVITVLIAVFLVLRWFASRDAAPLDGFTESALRVLTLMAAGHIMMARPGQQLGHIGRWRGHVLLGLGLVYTLIVPALATNPWWGSAPARVSGPLLLDSLTLAFAAPAAISLAAARRLYLFQRTFARIYAIAGGVLALLWAVLAVRRAAHGDQLASAPVGLLEGSAYALVFLGGALAVAIFARMRAVKHADGPFTQDLLRAIRAIAWAGLIAAGFFLLIGYHPWWGSHDSAATDQIQTGFAVFTQAIAVGLALALGRALSLSRQTEPARFASATAALLFAWSFGHAAIRWLYHAGAMDDGAPFFGLEGFAHALWPLVFVLGGAELTARAPGRDTIRAYLHDLQALWSAAIWPALGFAALGLWLLFNPWWGANPAAIASPLSAGIALACFALAAWLSVEAMHVPHLRWPIWFERIATIACIVHLLVAATLSVRWLHHGAAMSTAAAGDVELWVYSAVWALYGAAVFWLGLRRNDALIRWSGLVILLLTTVYVYFLIFTRLTGFIRAVTAIGLALVLFVVAWLARTHRPAPKPTDLLNITPGARRERRYGRRQRSQ